MTQENLTTSSCPDCYPCIPGFYVPGLAAAPDSTLGLHTLCLCFFFLSLDLICPASHPSKRHASASHTWNLPFPQLPRKHASLSHLYSLTISTLSLLSFDLRWGCGESGTAGLSFNAWSAATLKSPSQNLSALWKGNCSQCKLPHSPAMTANT